MSPTQQQNIEEYIYKLLDPFTHEVRWIGRTTNPQMRLLSHFASKNENSEKDAWIASLRERNVYPVMEIIETVLSGHPIERERHWIQWYLDQGAPLLNIVHNKRLPIIGYDPNQQKQRHQARWLQHILQRFPEELNPLDRFVFLTLFAMCEGSETPQPIQMKTIVELTGVTYHTLTNQGDTNREGILYRLHRLGLITYTRSSQQIMTITVHMSHIEKNGEAVS